MKLLITYSIVLVAFISGDEKVKYISYDFGGTFAMIEFENECFNYLERVGLYSYRTSGKFEIFNDTYILNSYDKSPLKVIDSVKINSNYSVINIHNIGHSGTVYLYKIGEQISAKNKNPFERDINLFKSNSFYLLPLGGVPTNKINVSKGYKYYISYEPIIYFENEIWKFHADTLFGRSSNGNYATFILSD